MLDIAGLTVDFGDVRALDSMSFTVPTGRLVGFVGPNGAGKTTTMRTIVGLVEPQGGSVRWDGVAIDADRRRRIGYMPEERGLYLKMPVLEQVTYLGRLTGMSAATANASAAKWLDHLGLDDRHDSDVLALSHGNQQRVQLAAALVHDPELLILDEPFSGLDPIALVTMTEMLTEIAERGTTVLFSSHQLDVVEDLCRDVIVVAKGRCVGQGDVDELRAASDTRIVRIGFDEETAWTGSELGRLVKSMPRTVHIAVPSDTEPQRALELAQAQGRVRSFRFEPPDLSDVFRELVA